MDYHPDDSRAVPDRPMSPPDEPDLDWIDEVHGDDFVSLCEHATEIHENIIAGLSDRDQTGWSDDNTDLIEPMVAGLGDFKPSPMRGKAIVTLHRWMIEQYDRCNTNESRFNQDEVRVLKYLMERV